MNGYLRTALIMPNIKLGNIRYNLKSMQDEILNANALNAKLCVFPKLNLSGIGLHDLFKDNNVLNDCINALLELKYFSNDKDITIVFSMPLLYKTSIYEVAVVIKSGAILGIVPNYTDDKFNNGIFNKQISEFDNVEIIDKDHNEVISVPFSDKLSFENNNISFSITFNNKIDKYSSTNLIINLNAIPETIDIEEKIRDLRQISKNTKSIILNVSPGPTESSDNNVFFGRSMVIEDGEVIAKNDILTNHILLSDIDLDKISKKQKNTMTKEVPFSYTNYIVNSPDEKLFREFDKTPYINKKVNPYHYSMHIINILAVALAKRMNAIGAKDIVLGVSGGLDSTIALLVVKKTIEFLSLTNDNIHAISMPGFGTTDNSNTNISALLSSINIKLNVIDIKNTTLSHFNDIKHDANNTNVTYENAQARERMQVLMDIANDLNGIVVGTSDLSEIALGYSTYNGDHMSMYNVNGSLYKTLIRYMLNAIADESLNSNIPLANVIKNILNSPITPELKPTENGILLQKTEDILGSYEVHDFILYNYLKYNFDIHKIYDLAIRTFVTNNNSRYSAEYIKNCVNVFFNRFYKAQYKRSTAPDSPDIGLPNLLKSFKMPSDIEIDISL